MKMPSYAPFYAMIGLFFLLYILPLGVRPIMVPDESRYAEIPREMIASGDWTVPHLNGLRYYEKPVLGYWVNAGSIMLFGENAFAIRFPSAMSAGISAMLLFLLVRRYAGGYSAGILAACMFLTFLEVYVLGILSVLDSMLTLFVTATMASFFFAYMEENSWKKTGFLAVSGIFCGLAFLTKGFIAFAIPLVTVVPFMIWEGRWKEILRVCWVPVVVAFLVLLPWALMIYLRESDFWHFFFWNEHVRRFISDTSQHNESMWYFLLVLPVAALPWTFLFPAAVCGMKKMYFKTPIVRFAICWFLFPLIFFSASSGKMLTYINPCFAPLAILTTMGLHNYFIKEGKRAFTTGILFLALLTAILAVTLVVVQTAGFHGLIRPYAETWKWILAVLGLLSWTLFLLFSVRESQYPKKMMLFVGSPIFIMFIAHFIMPGLTIAKKAPGELLLSNSYRIQPDTILVSGRGPVCAVCWFYKRSDVYLLGGAGELSYGLHYNDSKHRHLSLDQLRELILRNRGTGRVTLVAKARRYNDWRKSLPEPLFEDSNGNRGFIFAQF